MLTSTTVVVGSIDFRVPSMSQLRRTPDRRRRVLYQSHVSPHDPSTTANLRAADELRAPRLSITIVSFIILAVPVALTILHHLALTWPSLAYRDALARPLYINRPDSFAAWWLTMVLLVAAGTTRLIYVLRRHRRDDYPGLSQHTSPLLLNICGN